jgi:uncharacterized protein
MRNFVACSLAAAALSFSLAGMPALADTDPTVSQIYEAAQAGHLDQAQQMIAQVLRDHPASSKAHYVQAELYAKEGNPGLARSELARAEQLDPGLTKENPRSVQELKAELGLIRRADRPMGFGTTGAAQGPHFPWGTMIVLALVVAVFWMLFRRRRYVQPYPTGGAPMGTPGYGPGGYAGPGGGGYVGPAGGGGIGSSVAGGLAGGLAAGAGIVAGEELAHHFLDNGQRAAPPPGVDDASWGQNANGDMGGNDFGVNDPGSWDDGSGGGGGGGGDDWT